MFKNAIVREPGCSLVKGLATAQLGIPNYEMALAQHRRYAAALEHCGLSVSRLDADEAFPDSVFIEDTAVLIAEAAIITRPGTDLRQGEERSVAEALKRFYHTRHHIHSPGTLEGGDVLRIGNHFYIGLSNRTSQAGAEQLRDILNRYGYTSEVVSLKHMLHLKSGVAYLENRILLVAGELGTHPAFAGFALIAIDPNEAYAANSLWVNGRVLVPQGAKKTVRAVRDRGYEVIEVDVSEFRKLDGGLSCLSLRF